MRFVRLITLAGAMLMATPHAIADQALLDAIQRERLAAYRLMTQFHRMTIEEGSPASRDTMRKASETFTQQTATLLAQAEAQGQKDWASQLQQIALRFQQLAESNRIAEDGYLDFHTINDLAQSGHELITHLESLQISQVGQAGATLDPQIEQGPILDPLVEQAVLMQRITAEYVRTSAAVDGGSSIYDSAQDLEKAVDQLASAFSQDLAKLDNQYATSAEVSQRLDSVEVTWRFIEKPLMNYREKAVPLLVNRYNERIVGLLAR
ncbi:hypothetical protein [Atopomonas sediminilitoris]|uniref:hypothetical protein n=1 Tax=Atopomonas sediminilitoris TaxID=2919919 RepID=UPI001F4E711B|nr:hypothetical protein [Atopomonas sediminilitoris]MCJ8169896.1 hypothetical protein [Atopomonas sediminilitoris]